MNSDLKRELFFAILGLLIVILGPFAFIWALNTIFNLGIVWTWKHWFAVHALFIFFNSSERVKRLGD
jgi:hypothetical protein